MICKTLRLKIFPLISRYIWYYLYFRNTLCQNNIAQSILEYSKLVHLYIELFPHVVCKLSSIKSLLFYEGFQLTYLPSKRRLQMLKLLRFFKWEIHLPVKTCQSVFEIFYEWPSIHCCVIYHSCISKLFRIFNLCTLVYIQL